MIIKEVIERKPVKVSSKGNPMDNINRVKEAQLFIEEWHDTCLALPEYDDVWFIADGRLCVGKYEPNQQLFCMADGFGVELKDVRQWKYVGVDKQIAKYPKEKQIVAVQTPDYPCLITGIFTDHCIDDETGDEVSAIITDEEVYNFEDIIDWKRVLYWYVLPELPIVILDPVGDAITIALPDTEEVIVDRTGVTTNDLCCCEGEACSSTGPMSMDSGDVKSAIVNSNTLSEKCKGLKESVEEDMENVVAPPMEEEDIYDIDEPETVEEPVNEVSEEEVVETSDEDELNSSVKEWYLNSFDVDNLGSEISENVTFGDVMRCLEEHNDFYECIGVGDSVIRERVFEKLAEILNVEPLTVYYQWLKDDYDWFADVEEDSVEEEPVEEEAVDNEDLEIDPELKEDFDSLEDEDTDMKVEVENLPKELAEHTMRYFLNILREN